MKAKQQDQKSVSALVAVITCFICSSAARAVILPFDDVPDDYNLTVNGYAGITWEEGNVGVGGAPGLWRATAGPFNYPHTAPNDLINARGATLMGVQFPLPIQLEGAYVAVQGNINIAWTTGLRVHGFKLGQEVATTGWFTTISTTPEWFDMTVLTNVDRIVFESVPVYENTGYYGLDDLTFTYVPEPAGISLGLLALGGLLLRRSSRR